MEFSIAIVVLAGASHIFFIILTIWWACRKDGPCSKKARRKREQRRLGRRLQREEERAATERHEETADSFPSQNNNEDSGLVLNNETGAQSEQTRDSAPSFLTDRWISSLTSRISRVGVRIGPSHRPPARAVPDTVHWAPGGHININIEFDDYLPQYNEAVAMQVSDDVTRKYLKDLEAPPSYDEATK